MLKKYLFVLALIGLLTAVLVTTYNSTPSAVQSIQAVELVKRYYDALNAKEIETAIGFIADDAVFINPNRVLWQRLCRTADVEVCQSQFAQLSLYYRPNGTFQGKAQIREHLQGLANDGFTFELSKLKDHDGRVTYAYSMLHNGQLLHKVTNGLTLVKHGQIVFDGTEQTEPKSNAQPLDSVSVNEEYYNPLPLRKWSNSSSRLDAIAVIGNQTMKSYWRF